MNQTTCSSPKAKILRIASKKSRIFLTIQLSNSNVSVEKLFLVPKDQELSSDTLKNCCFSIKQRKDLLYAQLDLTQIPFHSFWDLNLQGVINGQRISSDVSFSKTRNLFLILRNFQCNVSDNWIFYPMRGDHGQIHFAYRRRSSYDNYRTRLKEILAFCIYVFLYPYWKKKRIWLVYEKYCFMAQDNGYYFFKYCMESLPTSQSKHIYYILDTSSPDYANVLPYRKNVIPFMSFRHMLYSMAASLYVASDSRKHLYLWHAKPNFVSSCIATHPIIFLQHGVTALKRVDHLFGKHGPANMTYFVTTSQFEQNIVVENFNYSPEQAPILGFTRWDVLEDTSSPNNKSILVMPTWRSWLEDKSAEEFKQSDYYKNYMEFLLDPRLNLLLEESQTKLIFYIHPKFKEYSTEFQTTASQIELVPFGSLPLNELIKQCSMLITDYSSVCWDVFYLNKPVLFYQFDYDRYMKEHGSYLDMQHDLFGERYLTYEELLSGIRETIYSGFQIKEKDAQRQKDFFAYKDNQNSKRTYDYLIKKGY